MNKIKGVTLLELLIAVLVMSILASVAGPSFMQSFERQKLIDATEQLYSYLQISRSEAISRSENIYMKLHGLSSTSWRYGMGLEEDCYPLRGNNTDSKACVIPRDDGDGVFNPADDNIVYRVLGSEYDQISLSVVGLGTPVHITFNKMNGMPNISGNFALKNQLGDQIFISMNRVGTIKICSDDISEYKACP